MRLWIVKAGESRRGHVNAVLIRAHDGEQALRLAVAYAADNDAFTGSDELPMVDPSVEPVEEEGAVGVLMVNEDGGW